MGNIGSAKIFKIIAASFTNSCCFPTLNIVFDLKGETEFSVTMAACGKSAAFQNFFASWTIPSWVMPFKSNREEWVRKATSVTNYPVLSFLFCAGVRTALLLQHPHLQLDEAVGVEAVVLPDTAVATLVAADVELVHGTDRPDLGVAHCALLQNVNQAPDTKTQRSKSSSSCCSGTNQSTVWTDSLVVLKVVFSHGVRAEGGIVLVGLADDPGFVIKAHLQVHK